MFFTAQSEKVVSCRQNNEKSNVQSTIQPQKQVQIQNLWGSYQNYTSRQKPKTLKDIIFKKQEQNKVYLCDQSMSYSIRQQQKQNQRGNQFEITNRPRQLQALSIDNNINSNSQAKFETDLQAKGTKSSRPVITKLRKAFKKYIINTFNDSANKIKQIFSEQYSQLGQSSMINQSANIQSSINSILPSQIGENNFLVKYKKKQLENNILLMEDTTQNFRQKQ